MASCRESTTRTGRVVTSPTQQVPVGDTLWHTTPYPPAAWDPVVWPGAGPGPVTAVACASVGGQLQLVGVDYPWPTLSGRGTGRLWHNLLTATGWSRYAGTIETQEGNDPGQFTAIGCAGVNGQLQVVGVAGGRLWHTIRFPDHWQGAFDLIDKGNLPWAIAVGCAGIDGALHVTGSMMLIFQ